MNSGKLASRPGSQPGAWEPVPRAVDAPLPATLPGEALAARFGPRAIRLERGLFEPVAFCAGYARGLAFHGDYAVVGLSRARENRTFQGLGLEAALTAKGAEARTGVLVIDLRTGDTPHWVRLSGVVTELYDVVALPGMVRPMALGFRNDEVQRMVSVGSWATLGEGE